MAKSLRSIVENKAEELGWSCSFEKQKRTVCNGGKWDKEVTEKYVEFSQMSPAGEDFSFYVFYDKLEDIPMEVYDYYEDFDVDDHVQMWLEAKDRGVGGVPSARTLVKDAEEIEEMILALSMAIRDAFGKRGIW